MHVLLEGGVAATLPYLKRLVASGNSARPEAMAVAQRIVEAWPADAQRPDWDLTGITSSESTHRATLIDALVELNAKDLLEQFIRETVTAAYDGSENAVLCRSARTRRTHVISRSATRF